jgi:hypothetical protein
VRLVLTAFCILLVSTGIAYAGSALLPGSYSPADYDVLVLNDSIPQRMIVYNIQPFMGDDIVIGLRYINLNSLNGLFGDSVTTGAFIVSLGNNPIIALSDVTDSVFAEVTGDINNFIGDDTLVALQFDLGESSDAIGFYRPWLYITDTIPPGPVTDLDTYNVLGISAKLSWSAPGDDSLSGQAQLYEMRYSRAMVDNDTSDWWQNATQVAGLPEPSLPASTDSCVISGLHPESLYYFALVTYDELGNQSGFSNIAACTTAASSNFCLYYDGSDYAKIPFDSVLNTGEQITLEAWYYLQSDFGGGHATIIDKPAPSHDNPFYQYNLVPVVPEDNIPDFYAQLAVNDQYNPIEIQSVGQVDTWMHAALTYDGYTERLYLNGDPVGEIPQEGTISSFDTDIKLGALGNLNTWFFKGYIDEISLWDVARTQDEIRETMNHSLHGDEQGLIAYWNFNEGQGQIFHDLTSNNVDGYLGDSLQIDERDPSWIESTAPIDTARVGIVETPNRKPSKIEIGQSYPNPFNSSTRISFKLPGDTHVNLEIYDMLGRKVITLADGQFKAGEHRLTWNGRSGSGDQLSSGVYFYRLKTASFDQTRKLLMLK